jgi:hypothetical protein
MSDPQDIFVSIDDDDDDDGAYGTMGGLLDSDDMFGDD